MATVQKKISESSSYTTRTLTTTISAPGIRSDAEISVSPNVDASKVSYVINEAAGTITVTLTNIGYTKDESYREIYMKEWPLTSQYTEPDVSGTGYFRYCVYGNGEVINAGGGQDPGFPAPSCPSSIQRQASLHVSWFHFEYAITIIYKTFPDFAIKVSNQKKKSIDGWAKISNTKRQLVRFWVRVNGQLKEI